MKLIIAGSPYTAAFTEADLARLEEIRPLVTEVVRGGAKGVDALSEQWAARHGIPVKRFSAVRAIYGRSTALIRNREMVAYADAIALFPGGYETRNMHWEAEAAGLTIYDWSGSDVH